MTVIVILILTSIIAYLAEGFHIVIIWFEL